MPLPIIGTNTLLLFNVDVLHSLSFLIKNLVNTIVGEHYPYLVNDEK